MISFSCTHCGMKFQVKTQFAGRSSSCPTCKRQIMVPAAGLAPTSVARGQIDGTPSSLAKAKSDGGISLDQPGGPARPGQAPVRDLLAHRANHSQRYVVEKEIARGGMGAVLRAVDCDIRREVAVKYLLDQTDSRKKLRFIEEAQITGQLEHPNIVPIHELGVDSQQRLFFSMKMVRGRSLAEVLEELRKHPRSAEKEFSLTRLLHVLVGACNALAYAHSCGVVHRDLKPANIMIGDFGEVYVMDWGVAKVVAARSSTDSPAAIPDSPSSSKLVTTARNSKVLNNRQPETDLTQDGAVLGTPAYMPPEQATGRIGAVDSRSDVYSLGAILYEMLTLQPPVDKEGGYLSVLMRAGQGEIIPPEQRDPERTRKGKVPKELAAIALKALATKPADRYPSAEALRRDIERFQEGRSVSAKEDSTLEMCWKLVKRNKGASLAAAAALVVLVCSVGFSLRSSWRANRALVDLKSEQKAKQEQALASVPAFVNAARLSVDQRKYDDALKQVNFALAYDPRNERALLLKGQVLIVQGELPAARTELQKYLELKPKDADARKLSDLCSNGRPGEVTTLLAFAQVFTKQDIPALADGLFRSTAHGKTSQEVRTKLLEVYRKRIEAAWPGRGRELSLDPTGIYELNLSNLPQLTNVAPLQGMPLTKLYLMNCGQLRDLSALKGMPLNVLLLNESSQVRDLTPLQGMPLSNLSLHRCTEISDFTVLRGMPLERLDIGLCKQVTNLEFLRGMKLTRLALVFCDRIRDLEPLHGMPLNYLDLHGCRLVRNLAPLQGMPLTELGLCHCIQIRDLTPLQGMKLHHLDMRQCSEVRDLTPLRGMNLTVLNLEGCGQVWDLTPLQGMKLTSLNLLGCRLVRDLSPLRGMPIADLSLWGCTEVRDLAPLRELPLTTLTLRNCPVEDIAPLRGMKLTTLDVRSCPKLHDLTPLAETTVSELWFDPKAITKGIEEIRRLKTLKTIGPENRRIPADEFWKRYDAGEFKK